MEPAAKESNILELTRAEQYKTVDELFRRSEPNSIYYTLLVLSSLIITSGLLLENAFIVIGGMLVTPVLSPVLVAGLGLAIGEPGAIKKAAVLMGKSFLVIILGAFVLTAIFGAPHGFAVFNNTMRTAILYFVVAAASGIAATFAWSRKEIAEVLPGIAIAVSLVPPLSLIGVWLSMFNLDAVRFYFMVFLFNLIGVLVGSLIVFSLLKFYKIEKQVQEKVDEVDKQ